MPCPGYLEGHRLSFVRLLPLNQSAMVEPIMAEALATIALGIIKTYKLHHHGKTTCPGQGTSRLCCLFLVDYCSGYILLLSSAL